MPALRSALLHERFAWPTALRPARVTLALVGLLLLAFSAAPVAAQTDTDGDGWSDSDELDCQFDPLDASSLPFDWDEDGFCDYKRLSGAAVDPEAFGGQGWQLQAPTSSVALPGLSGPSAEPGGLGIAGENVPLMDGRTIVLGQTLRGLVVYRLLADGTQDPTFGLGGAQFLPSNFESSSPRLVVQSTGDLVVVESHGNGALTLHRLAPDGSKTAPFASGASSILVRRPEVTSILQVAVDAMDRLLVASNASLFRLSADGVPDAIFGVGGEVACSFCPFELLADQRIMLVDDEGVEPLAFLRLTADGQTDATFGIGGRLAIPLPLGLGGPSAAVLVRRGAQLHLVANFFGGSPNRPALARFGTDGVIDSSYGTNGWSEPSYPGLFSTFFFGTELLVLSDGTAYLYVRDFGSSSSDFFVRIDATGAQDLTFGGTGTLALPFRSIADVKERNDTITVSGFGEDGSVPGFPMASGAVYVRRYTAAFAPDATFAGGDAFSRFNAFFAGSFLAGIGTSGGKLLVAGNSGASDREADVSEFLVTRSIDTKVYSRGCLLARFSSDGVPDGTFGDGGVRLLAPDNDCELADVVERRSGGFVAVGLTGPVFFPPSAFAMAVDANGDLDPSFGGGQGYVVSSTVRAWTRVEELSDGSLVVAGDDTIQKLSAAGVPDAGFGGPGGVVTLLGADALDLSVDASDRILAFSPSQGLVHAFLASGLPDASFGVGGQAVVGLLTRRVELGHWMDLAPDGRIVVATDGPGPVGPSGPVRLKRLLPDGGPDPSFDARVLPAGGVTLPDVGSIRPFLPGSAIAPQGSFSFSLASIDVDDEGYVTGTAAAPISPGGDAPEINTFVFQLDPFGQPVDDFEEIFAPASADWIQPVLAGNELVFDVARTPDHGLFLIGEQRDSQRPVGAIAKLLGEGDLDGDGVIARDDDDDDGDGVLDAVDDCRRTANGPALGSCWDPNLGPSGASCTLDAECGATEICVDVQSDTNGNGLGTVCDPVEVPEPGVASGLASGVALLLGLRAAIERRRPRPRRWAQIRSERSIFSLRPSVSQIVCAPLCRISTASRSVSLGSW